MGYADAGEGPCKDAPDPCLSTHRLIIGLVEGSSERQQRIYAELRSELRNKTS
jgi:hypothetical protein